jgi:hypothetical protein
MNNKDHVVLVVTHMDDTWTDMRFSPSDNVTWQPRAQGLIVRRQGRRTVFPWATVKSYTVYPRGTSSATSAAPQPSDGDQEVW